MTPNEAIETIKIAIADAEWNYPLDYAAAFDVAIEALEKQIPKKPLNPYGRYYGKAKGGNCPICGAGTNSVTYTYCRKCGQALDWGGKEERKEVFNDEIL